MIANSHRHKDELGVAYALSNIRAEEEILATTLLDNFIEPRLTRERAWTAQNLVDRKLVGVPRLNALRVQIDHGHADICPCLDGDHGTRWSTDVALVGVNKCNRINVRLRCSKC